MAKVHSAQCSASVHSSLTALSQYRPTSNPVCPAAAPHTYPEVNSTLPIFYLQHDCASRPTHASHAWSTASTPGHAASPYPDVGHGATRAANGNPSPPPVAICTSLARHCRSRRPLTGQPRWEGAPPAQRPLQVQPLLQSPSGRPPRHHPAAAATSSASATARRRSTCCPTSTTPPPNPRCATRLPEPRRPERSGQHRSSNKPGWAGTPRSGPRDPAGPDLVAGAGDSDAGVEVVAAPVASWSHGGPDGQTSGTGTGCSVRPPTAEVHDSPRLPGARPTFKLHR
jgi:hypothetical protein